MRLKNQRGIATVEFAIVLPLLALLLFGMVDFAVIVYNKQVITNASREGARAGIQRSSQTIENVVKNYCQDRLIPGGGTPTVVPTQVGSLPFQDDLEVIVTYVHSYMFAKIIGFESITLQARTVMKMEEDLSS